MIYPTSHVEQFSSIYPPKQVLHDAEFKHRMHMELHLILFWHRGPSYPILHLEQVSVEKHISQFAIVGHLILVQFIPV